MKQPVADGPQSDCRKHHRRRLAFVSVVMQVVHSDLDAILDATVALPVALATPLPAAP